MKDQSTTDEDMFGKTVTVQGGEASLPHAHIDLGTTEQAEKHPDAPLEGMTNQVQVVEPEHRQLAPQTSGAEGLIAMAINKDLSIEKLERLFAMKEREEEKTAYAAFVVAISSFQAECPVVKKTGTVTDKQGNRLYTYPKFDSIMTTIQPHLKKNSLSVRFNSEISDGTVTIRCMVSHAGGHTDESFFCCPVEATMTGGANAAQRTASANSFAKRYAIMNALNIAGSDCDDDGQSLGAEPAFITEEQAAKLRDEVAAIDGEEKFFCNWLCKVDSFDEIPENLFDKAQKAVSEQKKARTQQ